MAAKKYETTNVIASNQSSDAFRKAYGRDKLEAEPLELEALDGMDLDSMTPHQLELIATRLLYTDRHKRTEKEGPKAAGDGLLFHHQLNHRRRIEMMVADMTFSGDDAGSMSSEEGRPGVKTNNQQPLYNRSHPKGRRVNKKTSRIESGSGYYR